ncbi:TetR family transcriptional regulator C-terminal domain-containing protein [Saccharopolyspora phatthalungensis]|uniref:AcrR family transcriptional regulator n=1 Tax=Saccharopolyspora phatthalungensis TaxID=664693 RepID=A0A840QGW7_9PSEU|nr:TetR/AcrR family transcriptional regulator [Saccharopolyspora phatthalungensis]MBB5157879.1 AcrR family transcriptional regulator [Saccharopolyspora phatthalungensis]
MQDTTAALRQRVRDVLRKHPGSQRAFAERIGLDPTKLSKSLSGARRFTPVELTRIAELTNVTVNWLINGDDEFETVAAAPQRTARPEREPADFREAGRYQQILDAAWKLIAERGYHSVRVADVAKACGTSAATIHYYFPGRNDLLTETLRYSVRLAFDRQVAELHTIDGAHERLLRLVELQLPTPGLLRSEWSIWLQVWNESALNPDLQVLHSDSYTRWHETIARTIRQGQRQGVFAETDAEELTVTLTALIDGLGIQVLTGRPGRSVERMRRVLREFVEREIVRH